MTENTKLEIAVEIISAKIAKISEKRDSEELSKLIYERMEMYKGNQDIIDKIINIYGAEIKNCYENI